MALLQAYVARDTLLAWCIVGICVTILTTTARIYVRLKKQRGLHADDFALFVAVSLYIAMCALYIVDLPYLYAFFEYITGKAEMTPELPQIYAEMMKINYAVTSLFWGVLWSVKISLLLFFRRVIQYTAWVRIWWFIFAFTIITFVGCIVSMFTSCNSIENFTTLGKCITAGEQRRQIISLYYSFAADVLTELAVMALPLHVVRGLRISRRDKISTACLFGVGTIAIIVSFIRAFLIWAKTGSSTPSPAWLGLWAVIECMVAIICGCIPALSQIFRSSRGGSTPRYNSHYPYARRYVEDSGIYSGSERPRGRASQVISVPARALTSSSEEYLHPEFDGIYSKTEFTVKSEYIEHEVELPIMSPIPR